MPKDLNRRRRILYEPLRLSTRMIWFEHVFLPSIRHQSDPDFHVIVATGEDFPEPWRSQLADLVKDVPQVELFFAPPGHHGDACREIICDRMDPDADVVAQFRLDDDDAVSSDYVRRVRDDFRKYLADCYEENSLAALDHCHGLTFSVADNSPVVHKVTASLWTPALTVYTPTDHQNTVLDYPHHLLFRRMPVLSLQDSVMFVRGVHDWNDSNVGARTFTAILDLERARMLLRRRFGIKPWPFVQALSAVSDHVAG